MNPETLKEYLVSIGWDIHESDYKHATDVISKFGKEISAKISPNVKTLGTAASFVLDVLKVGNKIIAQTISTIADLDYETEKLARQWWVSEEAARSYSTALDALGETNEDLATMTDEQYRRLVELNQIGRGLEAPKELDDFLLTVRDIKFEFAKLKVEIQYGLRWVTYFFAKMNGTDAKNIRETLRSFNEKIQKNLPVIAKKIAEILNVFYRLGKAGLKLVTSLVDLVIYLFDLIYSFFGKAGVAASAFFLILKSGPIGWFITALTSLLLLIDDYMTWQRGGQSYFNWSGFDEKFRSMKEYVDDIKDDASKIRDVVGDIIDKLNLGNVVLGTFKTLVSAIESFTSLIADDFDRIGRVFEGIQNGDIFSAFKDFNLGEWFNQRTQNISDLYSNSAVNAVMPGTKSIGLLAGLFNKAYNWIFGSGETNKYTLPSVGQNVMTTNNNGVTINMNGMSWKFGNEQEATDWFNDYLTRRDFASPIK